MNNRKTNYFTKRSDLLYDLFCDIFLPIIFVIHTAILLNNQFHFKWISDTDIIISICILVLIVLSRMMHNRCDVYTFLVFASFLVLSILLIIKQYLLIEPPELILPDQLDGERYYIKAPTNESLRFWYNVKKNFKLILTIPFTFYLIYFMINIKLFFSKKYNL